MTDRTDPVLPAERVDAIFEALCDRRRRAILRCLREGDGGWMALVEVVERLLAEPGVASSLDRERLVVDLYHVQVPKLVACDVVGRDRSADAIRYDAPPLVDHLLAGESEWADTRSDVT